MKNDNNKQSNENYIFLIFVNLACHTKIGPNLFKTIKIHPWEENRYSYACPINRNNNIVKNFDIGLNLNSFELFHNNLRMLC